MSVIDKGRTVIDKVVGRGKQAVGDLTGDSDLHREGERDETRGETKEKVDRAAEKVDETTGKAREKSKQAADRAL